MTITPLLTDQLVKIDDYDVAVICRTDFRLK